MGVVCHCAARVEHGSLVDMRVEQQSSMLQVPHIDRHNHGGEGSKQIYCRDRLQQPGPFGTAAAVLSPAAGTHHGTCSRGFCSHQLRIHPASDTHRQSPAATLSCSGSMRHCRGRCHIDVGKWLPHARTHACRLRAR